MILYIRGADVYTPMESILRANILIQDDRISEVGPQVQCPPEAEVIVAEGLIAVPGFIDLQLNGGFGMDFTADPSTIWEVAARLPDHGVTAFLPTIITSRPETVAIAQIGLLNGRPPKFQGAKPLGLHLEGPFLNPAKRGAHNPNYLRQPDLNAVANWTRERGVRLVTLAPELPGATELIRCLSDQGVIVSAGHSMATYEEAQASFKAGVKYGTHLFNAMSPVDHRAPGLAVALLTDEWVTLGLIPDGVHVHPGLVKMVWQAKGPQGINVVTDAMGALDMPPGPYQLGDFAVTVDETSARLSDGRLAGSILSMDAALRNLIKFTGASLSEALATMTMVPARLLDLGDRGNIEPGSLADLVLLTPDLEVAITIIEGKVFQSNL